MKTRLFILAAVLLVLGGSLYFYWFKHQSSGFHVAGTSAFDELVRCEEKIDAPKAEFEARVIEAEKRVDEAKRLVFTKDDRRAFSALYWYLSALTDRRSAGKMLKQQDQMDAVVATNVTVMSPKVVQNNAELSRSATKYFTNSESRLKEARAEAAKFFD